MRGELMGKTVRFYYVRHGQTLFNVQDQMQGWSDSPLTEKGIADALEAKKTLKDIPFDRAYCSSSERCVDTAEIILEGRNVPLKRLKGLKEMNFGTYEGIVIPEHQEEIDAIRFHTFDWTPYGGEDLKMLEDRITKAYEEIYEEAKDGDSILIVSHGANFLHSLGFLFHLDKDLYMEEAFKGDQELLPIPNGFAAVFEREGEEYRLLQLVKRDPSFLEKLTGRIKEQT